MKSLFFGKNKKEFTPDKKEEERFHFWKKIEKLCAYAPPPRSNMSIPQRLYLVKKREAIFG